MSSNVLVCCRFRPANKRELAQNNTVISRIDDTRTTVTIASDALDTANQEDHRGTANNYVFDNAFDINSKQSEVFKAAAAPFIADIFNGYNVTLFAYGQTGSGKTHTMMGGDDDESRGIIPRLVEAIFNGIESTEDDIEFTLKLSYVEIYNERIRDLLNVNGGDNLKIRENNRGVYIENVSEHYVASYENVLEILLTGTTNRAVSATNMNEQSSRSHSVFIITLNQSNTRTGTKKSSKLTLVDLAGSEKVGKTGAAGQTLDEAKHINKSLSALGNVINALSKAGGSTSASHIPYRDSKLTRLLSDSLGGNSKTCLIITCSPMLYNVDETISTLRFGTRAKMIKNKPKMNAEKSVAEYKKELSAAHATIKVQQTIISTLEQDLNNLQGVLNRLDPSVLSSLRVPTLQSQQLNISKLAAEVNDLNRIGNEEDENGSADQQSSPRATESPSVDKSAGEDATAAAQRARAPSIASDLVQTLPARVSALTLANAELTQKLDELKAERQRLLDSIEDREAELDEQREISETEKEIMNLEMKNLMKELEEIRSIRTDAEKRDRDWESKQREFTLMKKKLEIMENEHAMALLEAKEEKRSLQAKLAEVMHELNEINTAESDEIKSKEMPEASEPVQSSNNLVPPSISTASTSGDSSPSDKNAASTPQKKTPPSTLSSPLSPFVKTPNSLSASVRAAMGITLSTAGIDSANAILEKRRRQRGSGSGSASRILSGNHSRQSSFALPEIDNLKDDKTKIETLTSALHRKTEQYSALQTAHASTTEQITLLEVLLAETQAQLNEAREETTKRTKELEEKLATAEALCRRFLEHGRLHMRQTSALPVGLSMGNFAMRGGASTSSTTAAAGSGSGSNSGASTPKVGHAKLIVPLQGTVASHKSTSSISK